MWGGFEKKVNLYAPAQRAKRGASRERKRPLDQKKGGNETYVIGFRDPKGAPTLKLKRRRKKRKTNHYLKTDTVFSYEKKSDGLLCYWQMGPTSNGSPGYCRNSSLRKKLPIKKDHLRDPKKVGHILPGNKTKNPPPPKKKTLNERRGGNSISGGRGECFKGREFFREQVNNNRAGGHQTERGRQSAIQNGRGTCGRLKKK